MKTVITGSGCYIPPVVKTNRDFTVHDFYGENEDRITTPPQEVVDKFQEITGIEERRYAAEEMNSSDMAIIAAKRPSKTAASIQKSLTRLFWRTTLETSSNTLFKPMYCRRWLQGLSRDWE